MQLVACYSTSSAVLKFSHLCSDVDRDHSLNCRRLDISSPVKEPCWAPPASAGPASESDLALVRGRRRKETLPLLAVHDAALERAGYVQPCRNTRDQLKLPPHSVKTESVCPPLPCERYV